MQNYIMKILNRFLLNMVHQEFHYPKRDLGKLSYKAELFHLFYQSMYKIYIMRSTQ